MEREIALAVVALVALSIAGHSFLNYLNYLDYLKETIHEAGRWAVIEDVNGHHIAVQPMSDEVWNQLLELHQQGTRMWIGGIVEEYDNKWGFRFKPENITIAEVTAEGLQATIQHISENLDYWIDLGWTYVSAEVTEIHE